ncbi:hypothetical protein, partial [Polaromonas sp.]|uniref:hypothetical protein n=1 Tax=Polaromonas sp. TaxID=1869339 RepID=UPI0013BD1663
SAPAPQATFFGDFLFCQKRKSPPAGKALTPQTEPKKTKEQKAENAAIKSAALAVVFYKKMTMALLQ